MLQGFQFDKMQVYPTSDTSLYSFLGDERNVIIPNRGNEMNVTTNELNITVDTGEALIQGRLVKITEPMSITIGANQSGYLVIEIDLSKANTSTGTAGQPDYTPINNQLSLKFVTQLTQDNINDDGLLYHFNLGMVTSSTTNISFTKNEKTNPMYQPTLFEGNVATGHIVLNDNMYNYRFLMFLIVDSRYPSNRGFGYGIFPVVRPEHIDFPSQNILMGNARNRGVNSLDTYCADIEYVNETTLNINVQFSNVTHLENGHGGATLYNVKKIIGIR